MGRGTSDTGGSTAIALRQRQLSDSAMDYATRQVIRGLAGQAEHTVHFFRMFASDPEWKETLEGTVAQVYEVAEAVEELTGQSDELQVASNGFDPRWDAISHLDRAALKLWEAAWTDDAVRFAAISAKLQQKAVAIDIAERPDQTEKLRRELSEGGDLSEAVQDAVAALTSEADERGVETPAFVLADRIEDAVFSKDREDDFQYADFRIIALEQLAG